MNSLYELTLLPPTWLDLAGSSQAESLPIATELRFLFTATEKCHQFDWLIVIWRFGLDSRIHIRTQLFESWIALQLWVLSAAIIPGRQADLETHTHTQRLSLTPRSISVLTAVCAASSEQLSVRYSKKTHMKQKNRQISNIEKAGWDRRTKPYQWDCNFFSQCIIEGCHLGTFWLSFMVFF